MNNLLPILLVALIVFIVYRIFLVGIGKLLSKQIKTTVSNEKYDPMISFCLIIAFISALITATAYFAKTDLEYYVSLCLIGAVCILWCYFDWELSSYFLLPHFTSERRNYYKKGFLFTLILGFSMVLGYKQVIVLGTDNKVDPIFNIANSTIIASILAADRVISQIYSLHKDKMKSLKYDKELKQTTTY